MSTSKTPGQNWYRQLSSSATRHFMTAAMHPYALILFSLLAIADSILPVLPAEVMAITLMFLQPRRAILIGTCFAVSASISAFVFSMLILKAKHFAMTMNAEILSAVENGSRVIEDWGAIALALLAIFPDSPRTSVAIATVGGLSPLAIASSVFIGKLVLYNTLRYLLINLPTIISVIQNTKLPLIAAIKPKLRRLVAFQRLLKRRNARHY